jgi:hypothetical protein
MKPKIRKVAVIGTGTLGTQIAVHSAYHGYDVSAYDADPKSLTKVLRMIQVRIANSNRKPAIPLKEIQRQAKKIKISSTIEEAVEGADLVIEAIPEDLMLKRMIFKEIDLFAPEKAILATNSSSIPVSRIECYPSARKCLNLHFIPLTWEEHRRCHGRKTTRQVLEAGRIGSVHRVRPLTVKKSFWIRFNRVWRAVKGRPSHVGRGIGLQGYRPGMDDLDGMSVPSDHGCGTGCGVWNRNGIL